ncbi:RecX family transcriptional regulator [Paenibacillus sp. KQZ6P-2]|uniref:Regulatory protein RecX n=1 Tax=Paenibacillus mangrovi TaxID=2931978 RepID=A0A9X2B3K5_9BACL|nr:RecX family transcriptional regulator [Paenibacillus mangrovi]MCJ8010682.1 RecX family transcriptional regulator [Paenibacillus mangrovi]
MQMEELHRQQEMTDINHFPDGMDLEITAIERQPKQKGRYLISFGEYTLSIHEDVMIKYRMLKGNLFTKQELEEIILADEKQRAYVQALKFLERKQRTRKELADRLREKEHAQTVIEHALERLEKEGLINDELYAKQWAEQRISSQRKGRAWVKQELRQKGVDKTVISEALAEVSQEQEYESCLVVGRKKWNQTHGEVMDRKRKTGAFLMRRGFSGEQVRQVINQLIRETGESEEDMEHFSFE